MSGVLLVRFKQNFLTELQTKTGWGKNDIEALFNKHFEKLLLNLIEQNDKELERSE